MKTNEQTIIICMNRAEAVKVLDILRPLGFTWNNRDNLDQDTLLIRESGGILHLGYRGDDTVVYQGLFPNCWDYKEFSVPLKTLVNAEIVTTEWVLKNIAGAKKPVEVRELTMEELNKISAEKLGYEIKIKKA